MKYAFGKKIPTAKTPRRKGDELASSRLRGSPKVIIGSSRRKVAKIFGNPFAKRGMITYHWRVQDDIVKQEGASFKRTMYDHCHSEDPDAFCRETKNLDCAEERVIRRPRAIQTLLPLEESSLSDDQRTAGSG